MHNLHNQLVKNLHSYQDLWQAIHKEEFEFYYQPVVSLNNNQIVGWEALARWFSPQQGLILPQEFIPLAEATGLIIPLGHWLLRQACQQIMIWQGKTSNKFPLQVSVNVSAIQLNQPDFLAQIDQLLEETGIDPFHLKLEITETVAMINLPVLINLLQQLKARGISLCLDDFGIGYSSLSYLHYFPFDTIKIDRSFVSRINGKKDKNWQITRTIMVLANSLNMEVVAEGIETEQQLVELQAMGCNYGQGYLFSPPVKSVVVPKLASKLLFSSAGQPRELCLSRVGQD